MSETPSDALASAADVEAYAARLYGGTCPAPVPGVSHVTACWRRPGALPTSPLVTLKINEHTPKSAADTFALGFARARADAMLVTGKLLRDEPATTFGLPGPGAPALARYRQEIALRYDAPLLVVLTKSGAVDPGHLAFGRGERELAAPRPLVLTGPEGAEVLAPKLEGTGVELQVLDALDP
ncbi:MAG: hypothetical protein AAF447_21820, partial [Myxococcota bacterium]